MSLYLFKSLSCDWNATLACNKLDSPINMKNKCAFQFLIDTWWTSDWKYILQNSTDCLNNNTQYIQWISLTDISISQFPHRVCSWRNAQLFWGFSTEFKWVMLLLVKLIDTSPSPLCMCGTVMCHFHMKIKVCGAVWRCVKNYICCWGRKRLILHSSCLSSFLLKKTLCYLKKICRSHLSLLITDTKLVYILYMLGERVTKITVQKYPRY